MDDDLEFYERAVMSNDQKASNAPQNAMVERPSAAAQKI